MDPFERGNFESAWKRKFEGATISPSEGLWNNIDHELTFQENKKLRGVLFWTRTAAAAAVALAFMAVAYNLYFDRSVVPINESVFAEENRISPEQEMDAASKPIDSDPSNLSTELENSNTSIPQHDQAMEGDANQLVNSPPLLAQEDETEQKMPDKISAQSVVLPDESGGRENLITLAGADPLGMSPLGPGTSPELYDRYIWKFQFEEEEEEKKSDLWAGISFAGGNISSGSRGFNAMEAISGDSYFDGGNLDNTNYSSKAIGGTSSVIGLSMGKQLTNRISVISGLQYANVVSGTYVGNDASINTENFTLAKESFSNTTSTDPAILQEDQFDYLTVPVKAGIKIVDKRIGLDLITGMDSRILIDEQSRQESYGTLKSVSIERNPSPLHLWGSMNLELNYRVTDNYMVSLSPGYKLSLNSMELGSNEHQSLAELAFSFRYLFPDK